MMEQHETDEVMIKRNGLRGHIVEEDASCGPRFVVYGIETQRRLPDGTVRCEKDWYFADEFIRYTQFVPMQVQAG